MLRRALGDLVAMQLGDRKEMAFLQAPKALDIRWAPFHPESDDAVIMETAVVTVDVTQMLGDGPEGLVCVAILGAIRASSSPTNMGSVRGDANEGSQAWFESVWSDRTLSQQFAIVGLIALTCGALFSAGWMVSSGAKQVLIELAALVMLNLLLTILSRSREMVAVHRCAARAGDEERARLLEQNADLRSQIDASQRRLVEIHDMVLRRVGVELHDGPAQLISLALLRLEGLLPEETAPDGERPYNDFERIRGALQEALAEIRSMSAGLTLPELVSVSPRDVLRLAVRNHERWTATLVTCKVEELPQRLPASIKSCLYRFTQEALSNAYRHGGGRDQTVRGRWCDDSIEVEVADAGPGFEPSETIAGGHLGLVGMRERIASAGGTLEIVSGRGCGTRLTARFKMADDKGVQECPECPIVFA